MSDTGRRVAIVGSGPSGFYAAEALLKDERKVQVDIVDRLPTPFGLVRGGVAPDHQKIKNVIRVYERTAGNERCGFIGNVMVGRDVSVADLRRYYDAIVFTCGAETDRTLNIPGIDLPGSHTATAFVGWYNGHPDYRHLSFDLSHEVAVVIGQGNVAVDVTRILAKTVDELVATDIAAHALEVLAESKVREVHMVGRRGPVQAAFTSKEIRELGELGDCALHFNDQADFDLNPESQARVGAIGQHRRAAQLEGAGRAARSRTGERLFEADRRSLLPQPQGAHRQRPCGAVDPGEEPPGRRGRRPVGGGYRRGLWRCRAGCSSAAWATAACRSRGLPFDDRRGVFPNQGGRITDDGAVVPGLYAAGWIKRGPSGVIGTNKPDSTETARNVLADLDGLAACAVPDTDALLAQLRDRGVRPVSYEDWRAIDAAEVARGAGAGKPREKFTRIPEMLGVLD